MNNVDRQSRTMDDQPAKTGWIEFDLPDQWFALKISVPLMWVDEYQHNGFRGWVADGAPVVVDVDFDPRPEASGARFDRGQIRSWKNASISDLPALVREHIRSEL